MIRSKELRQKYPEIAIPVFHIPVTISNNVPGTEYVVPQYSCLHSSHCLSLVMPHCIVR